MLRSTNRTRRWLANTTNRISPAFRASEDEWLIGSARKNDRLKICQRGRIVRGLVIRQGPLRLRALNLLQLTSAAIVSKRSEEMRNRPDKDNRETSDNRKSNLFRLRHKRWIDA